MSKFFKVNVSSVVFNGKSVLVQKRAQNEEVFPGLWGIPGGTVEMTDSSLEAALEREVLEEVGIKIKNHRLIKNNTKEKGLFGMLYIVFTSEYDTGDLVAMDETEKVGWMSLEEIQNMEFTPTTKETILFAYERKIS
jgi:ADP-ribose pyrophosphatase YjhB (NUDIX family)